MSCTCLGGASGSHGAADARALRDSRPSVAGALAGCPDVLPALPDSVIIGEHHLLRPRMARAAFEAAGGLELGVLSRVQ